MNPNQPPSSASWNWRLFADNTLPDGLFDHGESIGASLNLPDGRSIQPRTFAFPESGIADLWSILGYHPEPLSRTILVADFDEPEAATRIIGFGCDWELEMHLNGTRIVSTRELGNGENRINPWNHLMEIQTRKGHNQLIYELFAGEATFDVAFQLFDFPPLTLEFTPWVQYPDSSCGAVTIVYKTNRISPAGVDYRIRGTQDWTRVYDNLGGQIRRDRAEHQIRLEGLQADTDYEYRAVLLDQCRSFQEFALPEIRHFHTAPSAPRAFSFVTTSDVQISQDERSAYLKTLFSQPEAKAADFFAFLGDVCWTSDADLDLIKGFIQPFQDATESDKMLVMVRGNHEIYGQDSNRFFAYFTAPDPGREGYSMFRYGDTCFFMLDFCDDAGRRTDQSARALHDFEPYIAREAAWLNRIVDTPECQTARYRIVLAHGLPVGDLQDYMPGHARQVIDSVFGGTTPRCRIHLWLGGHVHYPLRTIPGQNAWYSRYNLPELYQKQSVPPPKIGTFYPFTVAVHAGPRSQSPDSLQTSNMLVTVSDDGIDVKSRDMDGTLFDHFRVHEDGSVEDVEHADWFRRFDY